MATIRQVADLAGVSVATVSRVLNNKSVVKIETKNKIDAAIKELNYVPNQVARSLYQQTSNLVGMIIPDINNPFYSTVVTSVERELKKYDFQLVLSFNTGDNNQKYTDAVMTLSQNNIAGIISSDFELIPSIDSEIPFVIFNGGNLQDNNYRVISDNFQGGKLSVQALKKHKPTKIVLQHGLLTIPTAQERFNGAIAALSENHISFELQEVTDFTLESAVLASKDLFNNYSNFDAVISANDIHAVEIIKQARSRMISIPKELQVVGYDGGFISTMFDPQITTIDQNADKIGTEVAKKMIKILISTDVNINHNEVIPVTLSEGKTTQ